MEAAQKSDIPLKGLATIVAQHASNAWCEQSLEFAAYLYLIVLFPTTLIPASLLGLSITLGSLVFSGWMGTVVDESRRLYFARRMIFAQKVFQSTVYACFAILFGPLRRTCSGAFLSRRTYTRLARLLVRSDDLPLGDDGHHSTWLVYALLGCLVLCATCGKLGTTGIDLAVDRDWILVISHSNSRNLTTFNTSLRRTSLTCRLLAPLVVSFLTAAPGISYASSVWILLGMSACSLVAELWWIGILWSVFPALQEDEERRSREDVCHRGVEPITTVATNDKGFVERVLDGAKETARDWVEFGRMPVFLSSVAISCVYLTTLSFDGIMLSYLKVERAFSDVFISSMRGLCVITGLLGTVVMPQLEKRLGLVRAGAWSLWFEIACLIPTVLCLYIGSGGRDSPSTHGSTLNIVVFFTTLALSRIGLYSFDLVQLQSIQVSMQSAFDLGKYVVVFIMNRPDEFRWTGLISLCAVFLGGLVYTAYVYNVRGHLLHWSLKGHGKDYSRHGDADDTHGYQLVRQSGDATRD